MVLTERSPVRLASPRASVYQRIVVEVLLQRTQAETVNRFFADFFKHFQSWDDIRSADPAVLGRFLKQLGLWRRRVAAL